MFRSDSWILMRSEFWTAVLSVLENMERAPWMMMRSRSILLRISVIFLFRSCEGVSCDTSELARGRGFRMGSTAMMGRCRGGHAQERGAGDVEEREKRGQRREGCEMGRRRYTGEDNPFPTGAETNNHSPATSRSRNSSHGKALHAGDPVRARYSRTQRRGTPAHSRSRGSPTRTETGSWRVKQCTAETAQRSSLI